MIKINIQNSLRSDLIIQKKQPAHKNSKSPEIFKGRTHTRVNDTVLNSPELRGIFSRIPKLEDQVKCIPCSEANKNKGQRRDLVLYYENIDAHLDSINQKNSVKVSNFQKNEPDSDALIEEEEEKPPDCL